MRELVPSSKLKTGSELSLESLEYEAQERRDAELRALDAELARTLQLQGKAL